jgi:hypothetical protein
MIIKTSELTGPALDWAVAKCEGRNVVHNPMGAQGGHGFWVWEDRETGHQQTVYTPIGPRTTPKTRNSGDVYSPSTDWAQGGPIIEREKITTSDALEAWAAGYNGTLSVFGPTLLIAAMRCYVARKLGETIDIPKELL